MYVLTLSASVHHYKLSSSLFRIGQTPVKLRIEAPASIHKFLRYSYSTSSDERESRPFHEKPDTSISVLISTTVMHLDIFVLCTQHCPHIHSHWSGVFNLFSGWRTLVVWDHLVPVSCVWCAQLGYKFLVTSFWYQKLGWRTWVVCHPA